MWVSRSWAQLANSGRGRPSQGLKPPPLSDPQEHRIWWQTGPAATPRHIGVLGFSLDVDHGSGLSSSHLQHHPPASSAGAHALRCTGHKAGKVRPTEVQSHPVYTCQQRHVILQPRRQAGRDAPQPLQLYFCRPFPCQGACRQRSQMFVAHEIQVPCSASGSSRSSGPPRHATC